MNVMKTTLVAIRPVLTQKDHFPVHATTLMYLEKTENRARVSNHSQILFELTGFIFSQGK